MNNKNYNFFLIAFFVILALPLLAAPPWFHPAPWGKALVFRIIVSILLFFLIWKIISGKIQINFKISSVFAPSSDGAPGRMTWWLLLALWGIFLLATIFSLNPYFSFWGSPYRAGGFLNFSLYIIFAILAFLIIKKKDWQKIWDFTLIIGVLASIMAIFQYFEVFKEYLIPHTGRPPATMGSPILLAVYLILLVFLVLVFAIKEKNLLKRIFYFSAFLMFLYVILITGTRAAYFGLLVGSFYFFFLYSVNLVHAKRKTLFLLVKILLGILLIISAYGVYYLNTNPKLPDYLQENKIVEQVSSRLSINLVLEDPRFSGWRILLESLKERPILGYGPENISIAFDKYYDPSLPNIYRESGTWWDRAHNFMLETAVTAGIPALIIYLSLFATLFWQLQKLKKKNPDDKLIYHGIQAVFVGYLTANFFSFDSFSTYLILFLIIAYSLFLIRKNNELTETGSLLTCKDRVSDSSRLWKYGIMLGLFCVLILFIWFAGLKPLSVNKEINWANHYSENNQCEKALERIDNVLSLRSNIDAYVRLQYINVIRNCLRENIERKYVLAPKAVEILREVKEMRPYHTRTWISLGNYLNVLIENKEAFKIENVEELIKEADACYQKAYELNPKREEVFLGWIENDFLSGNYQGVKLKAEQCINLNPKLTHCWWKKALAHIYLGELEQADENIAISIKMKYNINSGKSLVQLQQAYIKALETIEDIKDKIECYQRLADVYERLIIHVNPENFQYHASLAYIYRELGEYDKAREQAMIVLELSPESRQNIEDFLKTLP